MIVEMDIFLGREDEMIELTGDDLPDQIYIDIEGETGLAIPGSFGWGGDSGFQLDALLDIELSIFDEKQQNRRDENPCITEQFGEEYCSGDENTARCCPVQSGSGTFVRAAWISEGMQTVSVGLQRMVDGEFEDFCEGSLTFDIRREQEDPRLQPFSILVSDIEGFEEGTTARENFVSLAFDHAVWHETRDGLDVFPGEDWLFFHHILVQQYDEWREFYEYPRIVAWDGSTPIPESENGYTLNNLSRPSGLSPECVYGGSDQSSGCTPPGWFTQSGNGSIRPNDNAPGNLPCENSDGTLVVGGQTKLSDFSNSKALGCVINRTHHAAMHLAIPGAMRWVNESTFDPMFWRYHKWASGLRSAEGGPAVGAVTSGRTPAEPVGVWGQWEEAKADGPPGITSIWPPAGRSLAGLPGVLVVFWEPVVGLEASDLLVNGSPATAVENDGEWYVFTGFDSPGDGSTLSDPVDVTVSIAAGAVEDLEGEPFVGQSWSYTVSPDSDGDMIPDDRDNCPTVANRDQLNSDADLVHGFHAHPGMDPTFGAAGDDMGDACDIDSDNDKLSDELEELLGTGVRDPLDPDACPTDIKKIAPGVCGCGLSDRDRDGDDVPECVPPLLASTTTTTLPPAECGLPVSDGPVPLATDCLFILQTAVNLKDCIPECACALTGAMPAKATDALLCLNFALGLTSDVLCPCPDLP